MVRAATIDSGVEPTADVGGRDRILHAAAVRFSASGYADTTLRLIAADVDMKAGSLYYHFGSKDDLFASVLERGMTLMIDGFEHASTRLNDDFAQAPSARLAQHVDTHLSTLHGNFAFTSLHVTNFRNAPAAVRSAIVPLRDAYEAQWNQLLAELLPEHPAHEIAILRLVLFGAMNSSIEWFDADRGNLADFATIVTHQFWSGTAPAHEKDAS